MQGVTYQTYVKTVCRNCKNREQCNEELRIRLDNSIKCDKYGRKEEK